MRAPVVLLLVLATTACTTPHEPERDGVWISVPRERVECERTPEGVVCRSYRQKRIEDSAI